MLQRFGSESKATNGAKWFGRGQLWEPGVVISWGHRSGICQIDVQGSRLRLMEGDDRVALLDQIMWEGFKPTRIDGAIDYVGQGGRLWENAKASCERGELCILRSYGGNDRFTASGVVTRRHLSLGSRESPVCARIYDKGLEQSASATPGHWERLEVEWKADRALTVAQAVARSVANSREALAARILGAIDFRVVSGRSELSRRARCTWWSRLVDAASAIRVAAARNESTLDTWIQGFRSSYAPTILAFAEAAAVEPSTVLDLLLRGISPRRDANRLVVQFRTRVSSEAGWQGSRSRTEPPNRYYEPNALPAWIAMSDPNKAALMGPSHCRIGPLPTGTSAS